MNRLSKKIRNHAWRWLNNIRRSHPQPRQALLFDETFTESGVALKWKGSPPSPQQFPPLLTLRAIDKLSFFPPFVLSLHHGSVVGRRGDVVTAQGTIFTNISPEIPRRPHYHFLLDRGNMRRPQYIDDSVAVLNCGPYRNYFHFLFEAIGRLRFYQEAGVRPAYYCVAYTLPFQRELLAHFGVKEQQVIPLQKDTHVVARELWVASLPGYHNTNAEVHVKDTSTFDYIRQTLLDHIVSLSGQYATNIYIQRCGRRTLANEDELLKVLRKQGHWEDVRLEEHSVLKQAAIFYRARVIVSVHGAGLANLVYAMAGTQIIEIFSAHLIEFVYFQIATWRQLRYHAIIGTSPEKKSSDTIWVDPQHVLAYIEPIPIQ